MIKKTFLKSFLLLLCMIVGGASSAWGDEEILDFTAQGYINQQEISSVSATNFSVSFAKGSNNNTPKYFTSGTAIRAYGGNTMTISSTNTITNIVITFGSSDGSNAITANVGTYSDGIWSGSASSVIFTVGGTSGNRRITKVAVTYTPAGSTNTITTIGDKEVGVLKSITITPTSNNGTTPFSFSTVSDKISLSTTSGTSCTVTGLAVTGETDAVVVVGQAAGTHEGTNYLAASPINVNVSVVDNRTTPEITLSAAVVMTSGDDQTITVTTTHTGTRSVTSSNEDIVYAEINSSGNIEMLAGNLGGTATITLNIAENGDYKATSKSFTVDVEDGKTDPTVTIDSGELGINATKKFTISSNSNGAITPTMSSTYDDYATFVDNEDGTFSLTGKAVGTVKVNIVQAADGGYRAYNRDYDISVVDERSVPSFSFSVATKEVEWDDRGDYVAPVLTNRSDVTPVYSSSNTNVATVDSSTGVIAFVAGGETTITASVTGSATYKDAEASYTLVINKPFEFSETFDKASVSGSTFNNADNTGWSLSTAYIDTSEGVGSTNCARLASGSNGGSVTTPALTGMPTKAKMTFQAKSYGSDTGVFLSFLGTNCSVSPTSQTLTSSYAIYTVYITKTGDNPKVTISASTAKKRAYIDNVSITDLPKATFSISNVEVKEGKTTNAAVATNSTGAITFVSSDDDIATVAKVGDNYVVSGLGEGVATITATQAGTDYFKTTTTTFTVTVQSASTIMNPTLSASDGATVEISDNVTITAETGCTLKYTTDGTDPKASGTATAIDANTANVTVPTGIASLTVKAVAKNGENYSEVVTATYTVVKKTLVASFASDVIEVAIGADASEPVLTNPSGGAVTWTSSDETVARVASDGQITALKEGSATITASIATTDIYLAGSATYTVNVFDPTKVVIDFANNEFGLSSSRQEDGMTYTKGGVKLTFNKGESNNNPLIATNEYRFYSKSELVVSALNGYNLASITFEKTSGDGTFSVDNGTYSSLSWTGFSSEVTFTNTASAQTKVSKITINLTEVESVTLPAAIYATRCYEHALDFSGTGIKAYTVKVNAEKSTARVTEIAGGKVPAGEGVILYAEEAGDYAVPVIESAAALDNDLVGVTEDTAVPWTTGDYKYNYILQRSGSDYAFNKATGDKLAANRAYLQTTYKPADAGARLALVFDDDTTTGISDASRVDKEGTGSGFEIYNLKGQRVENPVKGQLYIVNGKKVVMK